MMNDTGNIEIILYLATKFNTLDTLVHDHHILKHINIDQALLLSTSVASSHHE